MVNIAATAGVLLEWSAVRAANVVCWLVLLKHCDQLGGRHEPRGTVCEEVVVIALGKKLGVGCAGHGDDAPDPPRELVVDAFGVCCEEQAKRVRLIKLVVHNVFEAVLDVVGVAFVEVGRDDCALALDKEQSAFVPDGHVRFTLPSIECLQNSVAGPKTEVGGAYEAPNLLLETGSARVRFLSEH